MVISVLRDHNAFKTLITSHPKTHSCYISEDLIPHKHCCENLKCHIKEALYHTRPTYLKVCSSSDYLWRVIVIMKLSNINLKIRKLTQKYLCLFSYLYPWLSLNTCGNNSCFNNISDGMLHTHFLLQWSSVFSS